MDPDRACLGNPVLMLDDLSTVVPKIHEESVYAFNYSLPAAIQLLDGHGKYQQTETSIPSSRRLRTTSKFRRISRKSYTSRDKY